MRRVAGSDRYGTSAVISSETFAAGVPSVLVATGMAYPDALAGVAAAAQLNVPFLLTDKAATPPVIVEEMRRLLK